MIHIRGDGGDSVGVDVRGRPQGPSLPGGPVERAPGVRLSLSGTCGGRWRGQTRHTRSWRSTWTGRFRGRRGWSRLEEPPTRRSACAPAGRRRRHDADLHGGGHHGGPVSSLVRRSAMPGNMVLPPVRMNRRSQDLDTRVTRASPRVVDTHQSCGAAVHPDRKTSKKTFFDTVLTLKCDSGGRHLQWRRGPLFLPPRRAQRPNVSCCGAESTPALPSSVHA